MNRTLGGIHLLWNAHSRQTLLMCLMPIEIQGVVPCTPVPQVCLPWTHSLHPSNLDATPLLLLQPYAWHLGWIIRFTIITYYPSTHYLLNDKITSHWHYAHEKGYHAQKYDSNNLLQRLLRSRWGSKWKYSKDTKSKIFETSLEWMKDVNKWFGKCNVS